MLLILLLFVACDSDNGLICGEGTHEENGVCVADTLLCKCQDTGDDDCSDLDGDGWLHEEDCNDGDASINPGATEKCNGVDDNCDGEIDEAGAVGEQSWYQDIDHDGYGSGTGVIACDPPSDYVSNNTDCDDYNADINPDAIDTWYDGIDSDCSGNNDFDQDEDGYNYDDDDCDDNNPLINPGQTEICDDGIDNNCDNTANDCGIKSMDLDSADAAITGAYVGSYAGSAVSYVGAFSGGYDDLLIGAPRDGSSSTNSGAAYIITGPISSISLAGASAVFYGEVSGDLAGTDVSDAGDINGDGNPDFLVGAPSEDSGGTTAGAAYLILGPGSGELYHSWKATGELAGANLGYSVSSAGDYNSDGYDDLIVGAYGSNNAGLFLGPLTGTSLLGEANLLLEGVNTGDAAGWAVCGGGDLDGDGIDDIAVGAFGEDTQGTNSGAVYIQTSGITGTISLGDTTSQYQGEAENDNAGYNLAIAGDLDSDGYEELLVGAPGNSHTANAAGAVYIIWGPSISMPLSSVETSIYGQMTSMRTGIDLDAAGDLDGDGYLDIVIGADRFSAIGAAFVFFGIERGTYSTEDADAILMGDDYSDWAGKAVAGVGDTDGNGIDDLLIGAYGDDTAGSDSGAAYLVLGGGL